MNNSGPLVVTCLLVVLEIHFKSLVIVNCVNNQSELIQGLGPNPLSKQAYTVSVTAHFALYFGENVTRFSFLYNLQNHKYE